MKIIFLDIDGVLNHCETRSGICSPTEPLPLPIAPECMARLNRLIADTGAKIVISSSWRKFARWQDLGPALMRHGLVGAVIGETPDLMKDVVWLERWPKRAGGPFKRGWEIREWLRRFAEGVCSCGHESDQHEGATAECYYNDHPSGASGCLCRQFDGTPLTGLVILDDRSDMAELTPCLVLTNPDVGLDDPDVKRAKELLARPALQSLSAVDGGHKVHLSTTETAQARSDNKTHLSATKVP